jgi:hypothetical protein
MGDQPQLRPFDIPVALRLAECPDRTFPALHKDLGISISTAHAAVERLRQSGLIYADARRVNHTALLEFLEHGVRYAFPAQLGTVQRGVPTAYAGPVLADEVVAAQAVVWPDPHGPSLGQSLTPLFPQASELPSRCPSVYAMLTLVDAMRMGRARERQLAMEYLRKRFADARCVTA